MKIQIVLMKLLFQYKKTGGKNSIKEIVFCKFKIYIKNMIWEFY